MADPPNHLPEGMLAAIAAYAKGPAGSGKSAVAGSPSALDQKDTAGGAVAGGGAKAASSRPHRSTGFDKLPGRRPMKEYPLAESDLFSLGLLQGGSALALAAAGACFGAWISIRPAVELAGHDASQKALGWWSGVGSAALWASIFFALIGVAMTALSGIRVYTIIKDTSHGRSR